MAKRTLPVNSPTPHSVWAYLQETGRQISEMGLKSDKRFAESRSQTDGCFAESRSQTDERLAESCRQAEERLAESRRQMEEQFAKTYKQIEELGRRIEETHKVAAETSKIVEETSRKVEGVSRNLGGIGNALGDIAEGFLTTDLFEKFHELGYDFEESIANYELCENGTKRFLAEIDMLMFNGTMALAIEAKTQMTVRDVNQHLKHMALLRSKPNRLLGGRKLYGAMSGIKITKKARNYAIQKGFFMIEPSGDTVKIEVPAGKPTIW